MTSEELLRLAERCEAATGPDRELDANIAAALGLPHGRDSGWCNKENGDYWVVDECAKPFTASLDAAMTLVPDRMAWVIGIDVAGKHFANVDFAARREGATPALALCAASLRSIASKGERHDQ